MYRVTIYKSDGTSKTHVASDREGALYIVGVAIQAVLIGSVKDGPTISKIVALTPTDRVLFEG